MGLSEGYCCKKSEVLNDTVGKGDGDVTSIGDVVSKKFGATIENLVNALFDAIVEMPKLYASHEEKVFMMLLEYQWFPDIETSCAVLPRLLEYVEAGNPSKAERFYRKYCLRYYNTEYLRVLVDRWEDHVVLKRRMPILRQAVDAHCKGQYFLSVPVLMAQIEGFIWDAKHHIGKIDQRKLRKFINELGLSKAATEFMVEHLLRYFEYGQDEEVPISRNAILHGYDTEYGTILNSLKLIMLVNLLTIVIDGA